MPVILILLFSYKISKKIHIKFIFDIYDMLATEPRNLVQRRILKAEKIINSSDATIVCTEQRKTQILNTSPKRLCIIHNSPSVSFLGHTNKFHLSKDSIKVVYVGILQEDRMLVELLDYFSIHKEFEFHTAGFGRLESTFLEASNKNENIYFYRKISYEETLELENKYDIMLAIYDPKHENNRNAAPNKFYESLMLGKPIIMVKSTGMSEVVKSNNLGVLIDYNQEFFNAGLNKLVLNNKEWESISLRGKKLYYSKYSWEKMSERLVELYKSIISEKENEKNTNCK